MQFIHRSVQKTCKIGKTLWEGSVLVVICGHLWSLTFFWKIIEAKYKIEFLQLTDVKNK